VKIEIPYGKGFLNLSVPSDRLLGVIRGSKIRRRNINRFLAESLKGKRLVCGRETLIVVPDNTRSAHLREVLPAILKKTGDRSRRVSIIVATGMHKRHTSSQLKDLLGERILKSTRVLCHDQSEASLARFGCTRNGVPIVLNRVLRKHDFIITIGVIEPHLYAGYSGGAKTVAIGLAGEETINATHGVRFLDDPGTKLGSIDGNPFQDVIWEIAKNIPVRFSVNLVNDSDGRAIGVFSGPLKDVFLEGVAFAKEIFELETKTQSDIAVCGIGSPKDVNLYQASRAVNYVLNVGRPVVRKGGAVIVAAALKDGIGEGLSEKRFYEELKCMASPGDFVEKIKRTDCLAGAHRAYMVAKKLADYKIAFVTRGRGDFMTGLPFPSFRDIRTALEYADSVTERDSKICVIPRALATVATAKKIFDPGTGPAFTKNGFTGVTRPCTNEFR